MGKFTVTLSERLRHTKIINGYCLICGSYGRLSQDHVPPQGSVTITKVEQIHLTEMLDIGTPNVKGARSPNGSKFRTICGECNMTALGQNDEEIAYVCKELTQKIWYFFSRANSPLPGVHLKFNALKYMRAMIGHVLSATSIQECQSEVKSTPYFDPLKDFVLGNDSAIDETHDVFVWFFPHAHHQSIKIFSVRNNGHDCCMSLLAFYPIAFLVTEKNRGIYPAGAIKIDRTDSELLLNLSMRNIKYSTFPAVELANDQMVLLVNNMSIVSYPVK